MADATRHAKTEKGITEIRTRRKNLRGRMRAMLILVDPSKTSHELYASAAQIGVETNFLDTLLRDGYVVAVPGPDNTASEAVARTVAKDELARFRAAKAFIYDSVVDALGVRAFMFTLRLERCSSRADLARLLPDYAKAIAKACPEAETRLLVERATSFVA